MCNVSFIPDCLQDYLFCFQQFGSDMTRFLFWFICLLILLDVLCASWICGVVSVITFGKFWTIIASVLFTPSGDSNCLYVTMLHMVSHFLDVSSPSALPPSSWFPLGDFYWPMFKFTDSAVSVSLLKLPTWWSCTLSPFSVQVSNTLIIVILDSLSDSSNTCFVIAVLFWWLLCLLGVFFQCPLYALLSFSKARQTCIGQEKQEWILFMTGNGHSFLPARPSVL